MKDLNLSSKSEAQNNSESVNRYFSKTNFAQIPNVLFLYAVQDGEPFDLVICDEAHRCVGKAGSNFTTILDDKKIKVKQKLFTTAKTLFVFGFSTIETKEMISWRKLWAC